MKGCRQLTDTHKHTPENDESNNRRSRSRTNKRLCQRRDNDENQLKTIHLLTSNNIRQRTEAHLPNHSSRRSRQLDGRVLWGSQRAALVVDLNPLACMNQNCSNTTLTIPNMIVSSDTQKMS